MDFSDLLQRVNLNNLQKHLLYGGETSEEPSKKTYTQRLKEVNKKTGAFLRSRFTDVSEFEEIFGYYIDGIAVYEEVYFEIGMILGAKIAFQIKEKMEELT